MTYCAGNCFKEKMLQRIAILGRARRYLPTKYRLLLYNASIKPLFTYCCTVWSNCSQTNLDELFKLQKRCARIILDSPWYARSFDNFQKLKWLPIDQMLKINKLGRLKKVIDRRAPEYLTASSDTLRFEHNYPTRAKTPYHHSKYLCKMILHFTYLYPFILTGVISVQYFCF